MNAELAQRVIQELLKCGVQEVCICAGSRNVPLCLAFNALPNIRVYNWPEERSAAFFALGRTKLTGHPVPIIVTSGTAAAELLPATIEAFYTGVPIILVTADRPRIYRGTGAPQAAHQPGLYGQFAPFAVDVEGDEPFSLCHWDQRAPAHLNICFEEPQSQPLVASTPLPPQKQEFFRKKLTADPTPIQQFLDQSENPLVIVSTLKPIARGLVKSFLLKLQAPIFLEAQSGLREDPELQHLALHFPEKLYPRAQEHGYTIDAVLRIGGLPTLRFWRDLEIIKNIPVFSINDVPFSGLTYGKIVPTDLDLFFSSLTIFKTFNPPRPWVKAEQEMRSVLFELCDEEPLAETALVRALSQQIPEESQVYLGNSLPIREWDLAATLEQRHYKVYASRGVNGIDGQLSTFFGLSDPDSENWAIIGDLTALYDLVAPWILPQLKNHKTTIVIINNCGAKFFGKLFSQPELQNRHSLAYKGFAEQWGLHYEKMTFIDTLSPYQFPRLIELNPDEAATLRFNQQSSMESLCKSLHCTVS